jgi:hypothetical protein
MDLIPILLTILVILVGTGIYLFWPKTVVPQTSTDSTVSSTVYTVPISPFYPANYGYYGLYGYPWIRSGWGGGWRRGGWHRGGRR